MSIYAWECFCVLCAFVCFWFGGYLCGATRDTRKRKELEDLVAHCWVHSGFRDCGSDQMTTRQKALYDAICHRTQV